jgi:Domain of unknown function (DUF4326)
VVTPQRIQRKRTKGWDMQKASPNGLPVVYVGRPTKWGNPHFVVNGNPEVCVQQYREHLQKFHLLVYDAKEFLVGKDLCCWCPLEDKDGNRVPCHADVLLEIANG